MKLQGISKEFSSFLLIVYVSSRGAPATAGVPGSSQRTRYVNSWGAGFLLSCIVECRFTLDGVKDFLEKRLFSFPYGTLACFFRFSLNIARESVSREPKALTDSGGAPYRTYGGALAHFGTKSVRRERSLIERKVRLTEAYARDLD
jgi:hypothetical protein